jgi:Inner membrane protein YgaP-like, transmembrane domain
MTVDEGLRMVAGTFILLSVALAIWVSPWFLAFTAFVGLNLLQSAFSRWCPMMWFLGKLGFRKA